MIIRPSSAPLCLGMFISASAFRKAFLPTDSKRFILPINRGGF
jgi:hypothetical protein